MGGTIVRALVRLLAGLMVIGHDAAPDAHGGWQA
jgi:hypothetical protein